MLASVRSRGARTVRRAFQAYNLEKSADPVR